MTRAMRAIPALVVALATALTGCSDPRAALSALPGSGCIADFDPATDYFPDKSTLTDATNFRIDYHRSYQILTVVHPYQGGQPESYVLVRCGAPAPELTGELTNAQRITIPVRSLYSGSTTHLAMIAELGRSDIITGVANPAAVADRQIRARIKADTIVGYASGGQINVERVIGAGPDVVVTEGLDDPGFAAVRRAGIPVLADAEWLESSPLGRAEWVKMFAALTGTERQAAAIYASIRDGYHALTNRAAGAQPIDVLVGALYSGNWSMPTADSYAGRLIADAGGTYPWLSKADTPYRLLNFETVYAHAGSAPVWLVTDDWKTLQDAVARDPRYAELTALRTGNVWSATKTRVADDANSYWERGPARPDLVLGDLVAILHPELADGHQFEFYRQVQR